MVQMRNINLITIPFHQISEVEFLHLVGELAKQKIRGIVAKSKSLHTISVFRQPNLYGIQAIAARGGKAQTIEACVEAEDMRYRLSVRTPTCIQVAEGHDGIFHAIDRVEIEDAAEWLAEQVGKSLTEDWITL